MPADDGKPVKGKKEFSRVVRIISESRLSGADIWDKLARESEELWAERKKSSYGEDKAVGK